jgi:hypothetical protein
MAAAKPVDLPYSFLQLTQNRMSFAPFALPNQSLVSPLVTPESAFYAS